MGLGLSHAVAKRPCKQTRRLSVHAGFILRTRLSDRVIRASPPKASVIPDIPVRKMGSFAGRISGMEAEMRAIAPAAKVSKASRRGAYSKKEVCA